MKQKYLGHLGILLVAAITLAGCGDASGAPGEPGAEGPQGAPGTAERVDIEAVAPGPECVAGGVRITTGVDADMSGELSADEAAAGDSTLQCNLESVAPCTDDLRINGVAGTDAPFVAGQPSAPLTVDLSSADNVRLILLGPDFDFNAEAQLGQFTITPHREGGPFFITVLATNGCSVDQASVTIDSVTASTD